MKLPVRLNRKSPTPALHPFTDYFQGFERVEAIRSVFGERTEEVLRGLRIGFIPNKGMYMGIRDNDGNIAVGTYHLRTSPTRTLYLDVVHELFHINQRMTDGKFFHDEFMKFMQDRSLYYASPIEIPAYKHTAREAERIGMSRKEILHYLKFGDPPHETWRNFVRAMELRKGPNKAKRVTRFPVRINREARAQLYPFTDYFLGFERVESVRRLFGERETVRMLRGLKVEFIDSPFPTVYPSEEDGHLVVATEYFRKGKLVSIYLDAFLCLNLLKALSGESLLDSEFDFGKSPGVLQAYSSMVEEARRLGVPDGELLGRLQLPRFMMSASDFRRFLKRLRLSPPPGTD